MNLSCREAAAKLGYIAASVTNMCSEGRFPNAFKNENGHWRIPEKDVTAYIENKPQKETFDADEIYKCWIKLGSLYKVGKIYGINKKRTSNILTNAGYDVGRKEAIKWRKAKMMLLENKCPIPCPFNGIDLPDCLDVGCLIPDWFFEYEQSK